MLTARRIAFVLAAALVGYLVLVGSRGLTLVDDGRPAFVLLGVAVLVLAMLGAWFLWAELRFGLAMQRLGRELTESHDPVTRKSANRLSGHRITVDVSDFAGCKASVEAAPSDWRAWYLLAIAYGDAGDNRRGRAAMRRAVSLHRDTATPG